jgi:hypothetical protein
MNKQHTDYLTKSYPLLYRRVKYFECSDGWFEIINTLSRKLEILIENQVREYGKGDFTPAASQIKEKFGALRFYMDSETDEMTEEIKKTQEISRETCEECGEEGKLRKQAWVKTLCDRCL